MSSDTVRPFLEKVISKMVGLIYVCMRTEGVGIGIGVRGGGLEGGGLLGGEGTSNRENTRWYQ